MIASLTGKVQSSTLNSLVLDVSGVGYLVQVTPSLALSVKVGDSLALVTAFVVREDAFTIYGFASNEELQTFDLLRSVTGVGPKSAMSIIHQLGVEALSQAVAAEDDSAFKTVSGIGPKTAKLIVVTLAGKLVSSKTSQSSPLDTDLVSALVGLGYQSKLAEETIRSVRKELPGAQSQEVLKAALKSLAKN